jgi:hypothetical protein
VVQCLSRRTVIGMLRQRPATEILSLAMKQCFALTRIGIGGRMAAILNPG